MKFLTEVLGDSYKNWKNNLIILKAPTGSGKTTFTIHKLVPYFVELNKGYRCSKVLIVVNRTTLKKQYERDFHAVYPSHVDVENAVTIKTYQQLSKEIEGYTDVTPLFAEFNLVVCDEAHFFYADSDFNSDAYILLHALLYATAFKTLVFMSATTEEVTPLIKESWQHCVMNYSMNYTPDNEVCPLNKREFIVLDHLIDSNFSRFKCRYISSMEDLATVYADSEGKSILFVDDKRKAEEFAELLGAEGLKSSEVKKLNADIMDRKETQKYIESLLRTHILPSKVLITTSVLDNGVSIIDDDIENICIVTYSKISFLQMLGRTRDTGKDINLIFLKPDQTDISTRFNTLQQEIELIDRHNLNDQSSAEWHSDLHRGHFIKKGWELENSMESRLYRKLFSICLNRPDYLRRDAEYSIRCPYVPFGNDTCFVLNKAALKKINDTYDTLYELNELVNEDKLAVAGYQMGWINHDIEELDFEFLDARNTNAEKMQNQMIEELLKIQNVDNGKLQEIKQKLTKDYFKPMYKNMVFGNGNRGCSTEKLEKILKSVGLCLATTVHDGKKHYSVRKEE